jgi:sulfite oxidase
VRRAAKAVAAGSFGAFSIAHAYVPPSLPTQAEIYHGFLCEVKSTSTPSPLQWPPEKANQSPLTRLVTRDEIARFVDSERVIVTFQGVVYDVTEFTGHPGGYGRLRMVAGQDLEPFWKVYTQHNRGHILEFLQRYRIGVLSAADAEAQRASSYFDNPYRNDPEPFDELLTNTRHPYNAEARLRDLAEEWVTPIGRHFVRNHGTVPDIDPKECVQDTSSYLRWLVHLLWLAPRLSACRYALLVQGLGVTPTLFSLEDLKTRFPRYEVTTVIQCNGNRREDYHFLKDGQPAFGPPHWVAGAIGNATWAGARMRDVLGAAGLDVDSISLRHADPPVGAEHVSFMGADHGACAPSPAPPPPSSRFRTHSHFPAPPTPYPHYADEVGNHYCCSVPFEKAGAANHSVVMIWFLRSSDFHLSYRSQVVDPFGDCLIAYEMNGQPIPRPHGFPVRAIIPGHAGARNCKYLQQVTVTAEPCLDAGVARVCVRVYVLCVLVFVCEV